MAKERNALRAGIFMLVSVAMVIFVIIAISGMGAFTQKFQTHQIVFSLSDDIGGLRVGDDVRIGGLKVGDVRDIRIDVKPVSGPPVVVVKVDLPERYHIAKDANVFVHGGITGAPTLNFDNLGTGELLAEGDVLTGKPDPFSAFTHALGAAGPKINADLDKFGNTADAATSTVNDLHKRIPEIVDRYKDVTAAAVKMLDAVRDFVGPSSGDFHTTVANLSAATTTLKEKMPGLVKQVQDILTKLDDTMTHANAAVVEIQKAVDNTRDLTGTARSLLVDNKSKFDSLVTSLKATSENLKYASMEIRHSPWRLLYQPKPGEVANMEIYDSMRQFAEGADSLDNAASALRDAVNDKSADPATIKKLMEQLNDSFAHFQEVQQKLWKEVQE